MTIHLRNALDHLKKKLLTLSAIVEESVQKAVRALRERSPELAQQVIDGDIEIDQMEVDVEEECQKILALHQPVAHDLRLIIAVLKINNDLERIGDLAVNIAERSLFLSHYDRIDAPFDFPGMSAKVQEMLRKSLDALVNQDPRTAYEVCTMDDDVDAINMGMYYQVQQGIQERPEDMEALIHLLSVSRHLERMGDLATNIAEDVIYMIRGEIVRHRTEHYEPTEDNSD
ncbi:MAG: phosphate signaling complex protein PhoU [Candidatus Hydrogenedentota bacterium]